MATSTVKTTHRIIHINGRQTNASGVAPLYSEIKDTDTVLWVHALGNSTANAMCIPFKYANSAAAWYVKIVDWQTLANNFPNTTFDLTVCVM